MRIRGLTSVVTLGAALLSAGTAQAQAITPTGVFGPQPTMTFGGTGIPNHSVMVSAGSILVPNGARSLPAMGLTAHQRFVGPDLLNDGNGIFFAAPGISNNPPSPADPYATWNVGFYIDRGVGRPYTYKLFYDFDPASGNAQSGHGVFDFGPLTTLIQGSWNMGMNFLDGGPTQPTFASFDPTAVGQYTFALVAFNGQGIESGRTAIQVNVGDSMNVIPEPSTYALMATGLVGLFGIARRRNSKNPA